MINLVSSVLIIYTWAAICVIILFLFAIARFYEEKSGRRSYYSLFFIPVILFSIAAIIFVFPKPGITGHIWADLMRFLGGIILGVAGFRLLNLMIGGRS